MAWVRTQDRERLSNFNDFWITPPRGGGWVLKGSLGDEDGMPIGEFPTKIKAKEALDAIQEWLTSEGGQGAYEVQP